MLRLKGIVYLTLTSILIWSDFYEVWLKQVAAWASTNYYLDLFTTLALIIVQLTVIVYWFKGLSITFFTLFMSEEAYRQTPFGRKATWNWDSAMSHCFGSSSDNVDKIKNYRDAKFSSMTNDEAADTYKKTAWVDGLDNNSGNNTVKTREYINAKLSTMDNDSALKWLKQ